MSQAGSTPAIPSSSSAPDLTGERPAGEVFRWLCLTTVITTFVLIVLGGVVRATGSGDACPDWPRCHGQLIPPFETDVLIEFSHRLLASVVGFLVVGLAIVAWRTERARPGVVAATGLALVLLIAQVILGGATVLTDLSAGMVMAHLAVASVFLAVLIGITLAAWQPAMPARPAAPIAPSFRNLLSIAAVSTLVLMLTGSYVSGSGAGLAFRDWPLFDGRIMPDGERLAMIHALHRFVAAAIGLLLIYVAVEARRSARGHAAIIAATTAAAVLVIAQAFVGASNIWTELEPAARASHLALAEAVWSATVCAAILAHAAVRRSSRAPAEAAQPGRVPGALPAGGPR